MAPVDKKLSRQKDAAADLAAEDHAAVVGAAPGPGASRRCRDHCGRFKRCPHKRKSKGRCVTRRKTKTHRRSLRSRSRGRRGRRPCKTPKRTHSRRRAEE